MKQKKKFGCGTIVWIIIGLMIVSSLFRAVSGRRDVQENSISQGSVPEESVKSSEATEPEQAAESAEPTVAEEPAEPSESAEPENPF